MYMLLSWTICKGEASFLKLLVSSAVTLRTRKDTSWSFSSKPQIHFMVNFYIYVHLRMKGLTKDVLLLVKQHLQDLQSTIRRTSIGETGFESKLAAYDLFRKKLKKEMVKWLRSLKGTKKNKPMIISDQLSVVDHNLVAVGNVLGEVRETTISIVDSLQSLMSIPRPKSGSLALKLMRME
ncbi:hypothetical protein CK203_005649 [Vitis vinifera]|uniref:Uncharacterized protein n=1 Tax=Vitis vinifera TaxID=29760 RepID=A0A438K4A1_VITVI|nr:hypothetical protein CK203_005649 [Vitis vinifera]